MSTVRPLLFLSLGGVIALLILRFSLFNLVQSQSPSGCTALSQTGEIDPTDTVAFWQNQAQPALIALNPQLSASQIQVLGATSTNKWIEIDLGKQKLIAHEGDQIFVETPISSGLWNSTPTGEYSIWYKIRSTKMEGGSRLNNTYYYLPNVPYSMFFFGDYGIHGTYWHNNFGTPMSHGCINTPTTIAEKLYYWTGPEIPAGKNLVRATPENPGTRVVIHD